LSSMGALGREAARQAHRFLERVERVNLVVDDAADGEVEAVGAEVDRAEGVVFHAWGSMPPACGVAGC
jgi:hypothetical protein